jgi:septum formation protein
MPLILASTSPRRRDLLALLQIPFEVIPPEASAELEALPANLAPPHQARLLAERKARSVAARYPEHVVLGSDTLIAVGSDVLGKPADIIETESMLCRLRGQEHLIHTGVAVVRGRQGSVDSAVESVRVWMRDLTDAEIHDYAAAGEGLGKAGGYAIQGRGVELIERIAGDFPAAVGLPLRLVAAMLERQGLRPPVDIAGLYQAKLYPNWARFSS